MPLGPRVGGRAGDPVGCPGRGGGPNVASGLHDERDEVGLVGVLRLKPRLPVRSGVAWLPRSTYVALGPGAHDADATWCHRRRSVGLAHESPTLVTPAVTDAVVPPHHPPPKALAAQAVARVCGKGHCRSSSLASAAHSTALFTYTCTMLHVYVRTSGRVPWLGVSRGPLVARGPLYGPQPAAAVYPPKWPARLVQQSKATY